MLFKSSVSLLIYSSVLFILNRSVHSQDDPLPRSKRAAANGDPLCVKQDTAIDAAYPPINITANTRKKRFVVFPEFVNYMGDWRYLQQEEEIRYWIANFYPKRVSQEALHDSIVHIFEQVKFALDKDIPILNATDPKNGNFQIDLFDYTKCPTDDTADATVADAQVYQSLYIYPAKLTQESRYRAHGGIILYDKDKPMSVVKLNMQQTFLVSTDYVYDPIIYTCLEPENVCQIDLYYVLLHEILHGFGIEHTTNGAQPIPPTERMQSVMHFSALRVMCHDDIRAIRFVYNMTVNRNNSKYDDTCRRDFPMNALQKLMYKIGKILLLVLLCMAIISVADFVLTMIYLLVRYLCRKRPDSLKKQTSMQSTSSWANADKHRRIKPHGYLFHDELL